MIETFLAGFFFLLIYIAVFWPPKSSRGIWRTLSTWIWFISVWLLVGLVSIAVMFVLGGLFNGNGEAIVGLSGLIVFSSLTAVAKRIQKRRQSEMPENSSTKG